MAYLKSIAGSGNFTASTSWNLCDANSLRNFTPSTTTVGTSNTYGSAWTPAANYTYLGVLLYCTTQNTTPGSTIRIGLYTSVGTTPLVSVTINSTDLLVGWNYVRFTSSQLVSTGTQYRTGINTSAGNVIMGVSSSTNFSGIAVTNTVQGIAVTDSFFVFGDLTGQGTSESATIVMNNTSSTLYGSTGGSATPSRIGNKGTLAYENNESTNYQLRLQTNLNVFNGGTLTIGTQASPIPSSSTAKLEFVCTAANQFGLGVGVAAESGSITTFGATKTPSAKLAANVAATATAATTDISTGWLSGDQLVIPPTNRVATQFDTPTLSGNASGTNLTFSAGLSFAHETSPSTPTASDIINLTRNVQIFGQGSGLVGTNTTTSTINGGICSFNNTAFYYFGNSTSVGTGGIQTNLTNANSSVSFDGCSFYGTTAAGTFIFYHQSTQATSTMSFTNNVVYNGHMQVGTNAALTPSTVTFDRSLLFRGMFIIQRMYITLTNFVIAGSGAAGFAFTDASIAVTANAGRIGTFDNLTTYCSTNFGFSFFVPGGGSNTYAYGTMSNLNAWRNVQQGFYHIGSAPQPLFISGMTLTSNGPTNNIQLLGSGQIYMKNVTTSSNATYPTLYAISMGASDKVYIVNSTFGSPVAESTAAILGGSNGSVYPANVCFYNTTFAADYPGIIGTQSQLPGRSTAYGISSMNHNGVANSTFNWQQMGTITADSTIFNISTYSMRMTPNNANQKMYSHPFRIAINANDTVTISVNIRKSDSTAYNGSQPRMLLAPTPLTDSPLNTVLATATGSTGVWETLTATYTPTATGVYEFILDCDGSTGWVNVDDWSTNYVNDTTKMDYWFMGMPDVNITGIPKERSNTFVY